MGQPLRVANFDTGQATAIFANMGILNAVYDFGADPTGATDSTAAIQAAINAAPARGSKVFLPAGDYKISANCGIGNGTSSAVSTKNGVVLIGAGPPVNKSIPYSTSTTRIFWAGSTNNTMFNVNGPLCGWGFQNIHLDAQNVAGVTCINLRSAQQGDCRNLVMSGFKIGLASQTWDLAGGLAGAGNVDSLHNNYTNIWAMIHDQPGAIAFLLSNSGNGTVTSDTDYSDFRNVEIGYDGTVNTLVGFYLQVCDGCVFHNVHVDGGNSNLLAVFFDYTVNNNFPASCKFFALDPGGANRCAANGAAGIGDNAIYALIKVNSGNTQTLSGVSYV